MTKSTVKKAAVKTEARTPVVKAEAPVTEANEVVKAEAVKTAPEKKETAKTPVKKAVEKAAPASEKKSAAKKEPVKKEEAPKAEKAAPAKKAAAKGEAEVKASVSIQFSGKDYTVERLLEIAKDVWQYDLGRKAEDFHTAQLYVKPEENAVYYVINEEVRGSFSI